MLRFLPSLWFGVLLIGVLCGTVRLWSQHGPVLSPALRISAVVSIVGFLLSLLLIRRNYPPHTLRDWFLVCLRVEGLCLACVLFLLTDWITTPYSWLAGEGARGLLLLFTMSCVFFCRSSASISRPVITVSALAVLIVLTFLQTTDGRLLFSDDHPVFYYRLETLKQMFPSIPFYMPWWNAGLDARDHIATGALNLFFLYAPLIYLFEVQAIYNLLIGITLFIIPPFAHYLGARVLGYDRRISSLAALISLGTSSLWLRWGLKFGTMGFCLSAALIPLLVALTIKALRERGVLSISETVLLGVCSSLIIFWSLSGIALLPLVLATLYFLPKLLVQRRMKILVSLLLIIHTPWIAMLFEVSKPLEVVTRSLNHSTRDFEATLHTTVSPTDQGTTIDAIPSSKQMRPATIDNKPAVRARSHSFSPEGILKLLRDNLKNVHPLLLFLLLPGLTLLRGRSERILYTATIFWLLVLAFPLSPLKPQLELERMVLVAFHLAALPVSCALSYLLQAAIGGERKRRNFYLLLFAFCMANVCTGIAMTVAGIQGHSWEKYHLRPPQVDTFLQAVQTLPQQELADDSLGRVVWPGFMLHQFYEGHIAPLILWLERPLAATSPFHNLWWYQEFVPRQVSAQGSQSIEAYLDLFRTTAVIVTQDSWKRYVRGHPEIYTLHAEVFPFGIYTRKTDVDSHFIEGSGRVIKEMLDRVVFELHTSDAVIAYRYFPFVEVVGCEVSAYQVTQEVQFIRLSDCPTNQELSLISVRPQTRLMNGVRRVAEQLFD